MLSIVLLCIPDQILTDLSLSIENEDRQDDIAKLILDLRKRLPRFDTILEREIKFLSKAFTEGK